MPEGNPHLREIWVSKIGSPRIVIIIDSLYDSQHTTFITADQVNFRIRNTVHILTLSIDRFLSKYTCLAPLIGHHYTHTSTNKIFRVVSVSTDDVCASVYLHVVLPGWLGPGLTGYSFYLDGAVEPNRIPIMDFVDNYTEIWAEDPRENVPAQATAQTYYSPLLSHIVKEPVVSATIWERLLKDADK